MKQQGVFLLSPESDASPLQFIIALSMKFTATHLYTLMTERGNVRQMYLVHEYKTITPARA